VTTPHGSRGGSVPPRHPAAGQPQQWFTLRPWVFDVTLAGVLLRATPRPPMPIPVADCARAYGLTREPGSGQHAISLIGALVRTLSPEAIWAAAPASRHHLPPGPGKNHATVGATDDLER
jgi:hypothetical protein